jgi:hypothetical protein
MSPSGYSRDPGKTSAEMRADEQTWKDNMPIVTSCAFAGCDWRYDVTTDDSYREEGRENARKVAAALQRLEDTA